MSGVLLCSDLDRTILPNGAQPESPQARPLLRAIARHPELTLVYVSGRHLGLLQQAIADYDIPLPDYAIGDVGSTIYEVKAGQWHPWTDWEDEIAFDWRGVSHDELAELFADIEALKLQEPEKQNTHKLSYYTSVNIERQELFETMYSRLDEQGVGASLIWSVDEEAGAGLLDVLPKSATKLGAIRFLMRRKGFTEKNTVFAGDSGNDLPVLLSGLQSVLVKNAHQDVVDELRQKMDCSAIKDKFYFARGGVMGMNGNYSAGVLEGLVHFIPEVKGWLEKQNN